jgi:hypothetical protein
MPLTGIEPLILEGADHLHDAREERALLLRGQVRHGGGHELRPGPRARAELRALLGRREQARARMAWIGGLRDQLLLDEHADRVADGRQRDAEPLLSSEPVSAPCVTSAARICPWVADSPSSFACCQACCFMASPILCRPVAMRDASGSVFSSKYGRLVRLMTLLT